jgi:signal recognition particle subunit SRP54
MGDVQTLIEKVEAQYDEEKTKELERKFKKADFDFNDYLEQFSQMKKMGGLGSIMKMLPGMGGAKANIPDIDEEQGDLAIRRVESIIYSMSKQERGNPDLLNPSRKKRIAGGAGVDIADVNRLVKQYEQSKKMMKQFSGMLSGKSNKRGGMRFPF